jgi:hypothetical protein
MSSRLTIVVGGYIVGYPLGGMTWHHLNYLLGRIPFRTIRSLGKARRIRLTAGIIWNGPLPITACPGDTVITPSLRTRIMGWAGGN